MSRWKSSFAASLVINFAIFAAGAVYMQYAAPKVEHTQEVIEMEIVSDDVAPISAPKVAAPKTEKVEIPPPPTPEQVKQAMQDVKNGVPINEKIEDKKTPDTPQPPTPTPQPDSNVNNNNTNTNTNNDNDNDTNSNDSNNNSNTPKASQASGPRRLSTPIPSIPTIPAGQATGSSATVSFTIEADGSVSGVYMSVSSGYGPADDAIISTVSDWSFYPATDDDGNAIAVSSSQTFGLEIK